MSWRPENWDINKVMWGIPQLTNEHGNILYPESNKALVEAGADAMLEAVKQNGCVSGTSLRNTGEIGWKNLKDGFWYFIPEDKDD